MNELQPSSGFDRSVDVLGQAIENLGIGGLGRSNFRSYRQVALTWLRLGIHQTLSGESCLPVERWQTLSAKLLRLQPQTVGT